MSQNKSDNDFGDFEEVKEENNQNAKTESEQDQAFIRVRLPKGKELVGIITQRLGGNRMEIKSTDGKIRNCRVPGRYRRILWLRPKNIVIVVPWEHDDKKADIIYKYNPSGINQLRKKGLLDNLTDEF